ncbi:MAG: hypothetical protein HQK54_05445 [Oligoflexales bacterium]|nr:hypothetical protein [Oligoflexales bacterium]
MTGGRGFCKRQFVFLAVFFYAASGCGKDDSCTHAGCAKSYERSYAFSDSPAGEMNLNPQKINGRLENIGGISALWLWGTRDEIGYAEGALLCGRITKVFKEYFLDHVITNMAKKPYGTIKALLPLKYKISMDDEIELKAMLRGMRDHCPPQDLIIKSGNLEFLAFGSRPIEYADLVVMHTLGDGGCSSLSVWGDLSDTGSTMQVRNFDYFTDTNSTIMNEHIVKIYKSSSNQNKKWVSISVPGITGCISCFTEDGASLTIEDVPDIKNPVTFMRPAPRILTARWALINSTGSDDFFSRMKNYYDKNFYNMGSNISLNVPCNNTSCTGSVTIETDGQRSHPDGAATIRYPGEKEPMLNTGNALIATNHHIKRHEPSVSGDSFERYRTLAQNVNEIAALSGKIGEKHLMDLIRLVARRGAYYTLNTTLFDASARTISLYVGDMNKPAPFQSPRVLKMDELFSRFDSFGQ